MHIDFETRSEIDLKVAGVYNYAAHPSTRVLCAAYTVGEEVRIWRTWLGEPMPADLRRALKTETIRAWNAAFERMIINKVLGFNLPIEQFRCTAAQARAMALPGKLELAAKVLRLPIQKGTTGTMLKWARPLRSGGWADDKAEYKALCDYCIIDVETERAIGARLRGLTDAEWADYHLCEKINDRGVPVDLRLARAATKYAKDELADVNVRLGRLTDNAITSPKQFARIKAWVHERHPLKADASGKITLDGRAREALLEADTLPPDVKEVVELVHSAGRASTSKFEAMTARASADARVRGAYILNGAGQTGRYSSVGLQLHNMVRDKLGNVEDVVDLVLAGAPPAKVTETSGHNMLTTLSRLLRPSIVADEGKSLVWGDWSAIEARVLPWLANDPDAQPLLDIFRANGDVYKHAASSIYEVPVGAVTKDQRQIGKVAVLALGYQGGKNAFRTMARAYGLSIPDAMAEEIKSAWRKANPWASSFWYALEAAAIDAVARPGSVHQAGRVAYMVRGDVLWCRLPSGRFLSYPEPRIEEDMVWGERRDVLTTIKGAFRPAAGETKWPRQKLYGGLLAENCTQAEAASLLRRALRELDKTPYDVIAHTHDEIILEVEDVDAAKETLLRIMTDDPYGGLPLAAEISHGYVYGK